MESPCGDSLSNPQLAAAPPRPQQGRRAWQGGRLLATARLIEFICLAKSFTAVSSALTQFSLPPVSSLSQHNHIATHTHTRFDFVWVFYANCCCCKISSIRLDYLHVGPPALCTPARLPFSTLFHSFDSALLFVVVSRL